MQFFDRNGRIKRRIESWYLDGLNMEAAYKQAIQDHTKTGALMLDAGAGKRCPYNSAGMEIVGADILGADLAQNPDIKYAVVTDLGSSFPFRQQSFDAITACYFMEHVPNTEKFIRDAAAVLKPSGKMFLLFPCRYAPFAVVNRIIPNKWTVWLLHRFLKDSHGGFPATYSNCWPKGMRRVLERNGFRIVFQKVCHYQAFYYAGFLPLYLLCLIGDAMTKVMKIETLAASALIVAERTPIGSGCDHDKN